MQKQQLVILFILMAASSARLCAEPTDEDEIAKQEKYYAYMKEVRRVMGSAYEGTELLNEAIYKRREFFGDLGLSSDCAVHLKLESPLGAWIGTRRQGSVQHYISQKMIDGQNQDKILGAIDAIAVILSLCDLYDLTKFLEKVVISDLPDDIKDKANQLLIAHKNITYVAKIQNLRGSKDLLCIIACAIAKWSADDLVRNMVGVPDDFLIKYEILNDKSQIDANKLAWVVDRDLNIQPIIKWFEDTLYELTGKNNIFGNVTDQEYIALAMDTFEYKQSILKHFGIQLSTEDRRVIYYDSDSKIHGFKKAEDNSILYTERLFLNYHIGFENDSVYQVLIKTAAKWEAENKLNISQYHWLKHNCQDFVYTVMQEYVKSGYMLYLKHNKDSKK